jgi:hypothetical protein
MTMMDTAGNLITLGVAYKMTNNLLSKSKPRKIKKKCKRNRR